MIKKFSTFLFLFLLLGTSINYSQILFTASLNGSNEVPAVTTMGTATAWAVLSPDMTSLTFHITYAQLDSTFTAAHFHIGSAGVNGGVIFPITNFFNQNTATGTWDNLPDTILTKLLNGGLYLNIHSLAHPGGEIRGQLYPVQGIGFTAMLNAAQETPPTTSNATGTAWAVLSNKGSMISYSITVAGLSSNFSSAHFHVGEMGTAGGVVHPITFTDSSAVGTWSGVPDSLITRFLSNGLYLNVHTTNNPGGEIRGQLTHQGEISFKADLDGTQETPPTNTVGTGTAWAVLSSDMKTLFYDVTYANLDSTFTAGHIHLGAMGTAGGVVKVLSFTNNNAMGSWTSFPDTMVKHLIKEDLYVNVHSLKNPGGEIRGQLELNMGVGFTAHLDGAQETPPVTTNSKGTGWFSLDNDSLYFQITFAGLSSALTGSHFHIGAMGVSGGVVHPFTFSDSTLNSVWADLSNDNLAALLKGNIYVNVHSSNNPAGEIRGQVLFTNIISGNVPVELTSFNAAVKENSVELLWNTATEINNSGFEIERSRDNVNFTKLGFIKGNGTSSEMHTYKFTDNKFSKTGTFYYRLKQINLDGSFEYSKVINVTIGAALTFKLSQNYPNPFNPITTISFQLPEKALVTIKVYNILGQEVAVLLNSSKEAGTYQINFDGANLASGIYIYRLSTNTGIIATKKMTLLK
jgi:hypothetical protein